MKTIITKTAAQNILKQKYDYHVAGIINSLMDNNKEDVNAGHTFKEVVEMILGWILSDVADMNKQSKEQIQQSFSNQEIKDLISNWLRNEEDLKFIKRMGFINDFKDLEDEIKNKEIELTMLKLRLLKKKLVTSEKEDVTFNDYKIMKEIVRIWEKK